MLLRTIGQPQRSVGRIGQRGDAGDAFRQVDGLAGFAQRAVVKRNRERAVMHLRRAR